MMQFSPQRSIVLILSTFLLLTELLYLEGFTLSCFAASKKPSIRRSIANSKISLALVRGKNLSPIAPYTLIRRSQKISLSRVSGDGINIRFHIPRNTPSLEVTYKGKVQRLTPRHPYLNMNGKNRPYPFFPVEETMIFMITPCDKEGTPLPQQTVSIQIQFIDDMVGSEESVEDVSINLWESHMRDSGRKACNSTTIQSNSTWEGGAWYYDGIRVFYQIADYTHDSSWNLCAQYVRNIYRDYVLDNKGRVPGWRVFPEGLYQDYLRTKDTRSKDAVMLLTQNSAFAVSGGGASADLSRETAYILEAYIVSEKLGAPRSQNFSRSTNYALGHLQQWTRGQTSFFQPFMMGLTVEALIRSYETSPNSQIPEAIKNALDWLWKTTWNGRFFPYVLCQSSATTEACRGDHSKEGVDLSLLIAPAYAWYYSHSHDRTYQDRAIKIFNEGVKNAYLANGKQFSQNYRWSFDFIKWIQ